MDEKQDTKPKTQESFAEIDSQGQCKQNTDAKGDEELKAEQRREMIEKVGPGLNELMYSMEELSLYHDDIPSKLQGVTANSMVMARHLKKLGISRSDLKGGIAEADLP